MVKTFFVSGASRGLGLEFVRQISKRGDRVVAACRTPAKASELQALKGENVKIIQLDTVDEASVKAAVAETEAFFPDGLDVLVNNAGIYGVGPSADETQKDDLINVFNVNVIATVQMMQHFMPLVKKSQNGVIANISSILGSIDTISNQKDTRGLSYRVSKAALNMASVQFANVYAKDGPIIFPMHPGWVQTDMGGPSAQLTPAESISGMLKVIDNATAETNGKYLQWNGQSLSW